MDLDTWGTKISSIQENDNKIIIRKKGSKYIYNIEIINNNPLTYNVTLSLPINEINEIFLTFKDIQNISFNNLNSFTRYIGSNEYYFIDGELELRINPKKTSFLELNNIHENKFGKKIIPQLDNKIITLDIETQVINNTIKPILISIYDGITHYSFYLPDYKNKLEMFNSALNILLYPKYNGYKIYVHNLSNFDGIFLMKYFINLKYNNENVYIKPIIKDGKFINININFDRYKISFRDSLLILLSSLNKLSKAFTLDNKGKFDFNKVNNLTIEELNNNKLREEIIKYCNLDCKILYDILIKFNQFIFDLYELNINNYPTLPSLAFGIYRSKYLNKK